MLLPTGTGSWSVPKTTMAGIGQFVLCVLVRLGQNWTRVCLTLVAVPLGLLTLLSGASVVAEGFPVVAAPVVLLGLVNVLGVVLLYLPPTNAYFTHLRRLRDAARPPLRPG